MLRLILRFRLDLTLRFLLNLTITILFKLIHTSTVIMRITYVIFFSGLIYISTKAYNIYFLYIFRKFPNFLWFHNWNYKKLYEYYCDKFADLTIKIEFFKLHIREQFCLEETILTNLFTNFYGVAISEKNYGAVFAEHF